MTVMTPEAPAQVPAAPAVSDPAAAYTETVSPNGALIRVPKVPTLTAMHDRCDLNIEPKVRGNLGGRANCGAQAFVFAKLTADEESATGLNVCAHHAVKEWDKLTTTFAVIIDERFAINPQPSVSANAD